MRPFNIDSNSNCMGSTKTDSIYFAKESRIAVNNLTSSEGSAGAAGASSSAFLAAFMPLITVNNAKATITKVNMALMKRP